MFSDNYIRLCKEKGVGVTVASQEIGYSANSGKKWSEGSVPRKTTLLKIAEYFGVTVDELMEGQPTMSYGGAPLLDMKKAACRARAKLRGPVSGFAACSMMGDGPRLWSMSLCKTHLVARQALSDLAICEIVQGTILGRLRDRSLRGRRRSRQGRTRDRRRTGPAPA